MKYRIRCASLEVDLELGEAEPLNAAITGLLSRGLPPLDDDSTAAARLRAKVADLRAERERRADADAEPAEPPGPKPPH